MKTISRFTNALVTWFQTTDIGAYFAPLFRPVVTEQNRLRPILVRSTQDETARQQTFLSRSRPDQP